MLIGVPRRRHPNLSATQNCIAGTAHANSMVKVEQLFVAFRSRALCRGRPSKEEDIVAVIEVAAEARRWLARGTVR